MTEHASLVTKLSKELSEFENKLRRHGVADTTADEIHTVFQWWLRIEGEVYWDSAVYINAEFRTSS